MILGQVSYIDCIVFLVFLAPQLLYRVGLFSTLSCAVRALPFLSMSLLHINFMCTSSFPASLYSSQIYEYLRKYTDIIIVIKLPIAFVYEHTLVSHKRQNPFVQQASLFEDFVIRCVRYAFANIPCKIGRVFFSKPVALPFLRFRMLRHGYLFSPVHWHEVKEVNASSQSSS